MFDTIKATLLKLSEMSWENLRDFKAWMKRSQSFNKNFDVEAFNNPTLKIAQAVNQQGTTVVFCPVETVLMVSAYCVNPNVDPIEARQAGDYLDAAIAREAQTTGASKIVIVVPDGFPPLEGEWKHVRVYERQVPLRINNSAMDQMTHSQAAQYCN